LRNPVLAARKPEERYALRFDPPAHRAVTHAQQ
jgi:hypothetical protein